MNKHGLAICLRWCVGVVTFVVVVQLMSALKTGAVSGSRFAKAAELSAEMAQAIPIARSGGGV